MGPRDGLGQVLLTACRSWCFTVSLCHGWGKFWGSPGQGLPSVRGVGLVWGL